MGARDTSLVPRVPKHLYGRRFATLSANIFIFSGAVLTMVRSLHFVVEERWQT